MALSAEKSEIISGEIAKLLKRGVIKECDREKVILFKYIDLGIKLDNNKYNQKLPHIYLMTKWMANNYFLS